MRPSVLRFVRTATFRLTLLYAVIFGLSTIALFAYLYWQVSVHVYEHERAEIDIELALLMETDQHRGREALLQEINGRTQAGQPAALYYYLADPDGRRLAGSVDTLPRRAGFFETKVNPLARLGDPPPRPELAIFRGVELPDKVFVAVGRDVDDLSSINEGILKRFLGALSAAVLLAFAGGSILSLGALRKLESINRTAGTIMEGKMSERIPLSGSRDELDQLAANLNRMLDRIQGLVETTRQVSNDIAHDLRTPLSRLRQRLEAARDAGTAAPEDTLHVAVEEIDAILATFSALLRIAQIEAGARSAGFKAIDLSGVFAMVAEVYAPVAEDQGQTLLSSVELGLRMAGDRELLIQMLANLVENALRYAPRGSTIALSLSRAKGEGGRIVGVVADNGPGIPEAERRKVFGRFYRLERNRTTPGNGLGLSLVAAVAELHGLDLTLHDNTPGLRVRIAFPEAQS